MTFKQVFVVNKDLKMGKGKIAVQVAHGEVFYMRAIYNRKVDTCMEERFHDWIEDGVMKKIVLKATQEEMLLLIGLLKSMNDTIWFDIVYDKGLTQVPVDSMTCIVFEPLDEKEVYERFGYLKLL